MSEISKSEKFKLSRTHLRSPARTQTDHLDYLIMHTTFTLIILIWFFLKKTGANVNKQRITECKIWQSQ